MEKGLKIKIIIGAVLVCILVAVLAVALKIKYTPSETMGSLDGYYDVSEREAVIIIEKDIYEETALLQDGEVYVSYDMVTALLTDEFYLDTEENVFSYVLPEELIRLETGKAVYYRNDEVCKLDAPALLLLNGRYYMSLSFVSMFADMMYEFYENPNRVVIHHRWIEFLYYDVAEEAPVRFQPDIKSDIIRYVPEGEKLYYIGGSGTGGSSFIKVMLEDGIYGYVQKKFLSESYYDTRQSTYIEPEHTYYSMEDKVRLGWHVVTVPAANDNLEKMVKNAKEMNVISPTWYALTDNEGNFSSLADASYVERAHAMGLQVWALIDNFSDNVDTYELLSSTMTRQKLIDRMMTEAETYGFDGWNIDFETLASKTGPHYIQFIKELSVRCKKAGLVLSVDNYVPAPYNAFYDLETQGKFVDYVIIMSYDEHYAGSAEAGSVASIGFLKDAVNNTMQVMPKERIVMASPFYTRLWAEEQAGDSVKVTSEALTMNGGQDVLKRNGITAKWDADCGQNYAEYTLAGVTYKIWLEDVDSLTERLNVIGGADVAGIAAWRLGFETDEVWPIIGNYIK